jgi:hypothetical protein
VPADGTVAELRLKTGDSPIDLPLRFSVVRPRGDGSVEVITTTNPVFPLPAHSAKVHIYKTSDVSFPCCKVRKGDIVTVDNAAGGVATELMGDGYASTSRRCAGA